MTVNSFSNLNNDALINSNLMRANSERQINKLEQLSSKAERAELSPKETEKLKKAAMDFEALFINRMLKQMRKGVHENALFGNSHAEKMYRSMLDTEYSKEMSKSGGFGLAETLLNQFGVDIKRSSVENMARPCDGSISSKFGIRKHPIHGEMRQHNGIDIAVPEGTTVRSASRGKVVFSGEKPGYGNVVTVKHLGGFESTYAHNSELLVKKGDIVKHGQVIAKSGNTGTSTGPHLHFELRKEGKPVDPMRLFAK